MGKKYVFLKDGITTVTIVYNIVYGGPQGRLEDFHSTVSSLVTESQWTMDTQTSSMVVVRHGVFR